jgi:RHS repeat-associated protein
MKRFLFLILSSISLFGEPLELPFHDVKHGSPAIVAGCVNVMTGEFLERATDIKLIGPTVLSFERGYSSQETGSQKFFKGWRHNHLGEAKVFYQSTELFYRGGLSSSAFFVDGTFQKNKNQIHFGRRGATSFSADVKLSEKAVVIKKGNHISFEFNNLEEDYFEYENSYKKYGLSKTTFLDRGVFSYQYKKSHQLSRISNLSLDRKSSFGSLTFEWKEKGCTIKASDGQQVRYEITEKTKGDQLISAVYPNNAPFTKYTYVDKKNLINKRIRPQGRTLCIDYEDNSFRVKNLQSPSGKEGAFSKTHRFSYKKEGEKVVLARLLDGNKNITEYEIDKGELKAIVTFGKGKQGPLYREEFSFDDSGQLIQQTLKNSKGVLKAQHLFEYEKEGLLSQEKLIGNLSGKKEILVKKFTYTDNNLLKSETNGLDLKTKYTYLKNTDLIASKFLVSEGKILLRTFFSYDKNGALVEVIRDDGTHEKKECLYGVRNRFIQRFTLRTEAPFGLPEIQEEFAIDLLTGQEVSLVKKIFDYNERGYLLKEALYNAKGEFQYETLFEYDSHGNCTKEVNPLGDEVTRSYDENDNLIEEKKSDTHIKYFEYDLMNRKVKEEICCKGNRVSSTFGYDVMGHLVKTEDSSGRVTQFINDHRGNPIKVIHPNGGIETFEYNIFGKASVKYDACGLKTVSYMTLLGKPYRVIFPDGKEEVMQYDLLGRLKVKKTSDGAEIRNTFDSLGRLIKEEHFMNGELYRFKTWTYTAFYLVSETDFEGVTTNYTYDFAGRVISIVRGNEVTKFTYDDLGRESSIIKEGLTHKKEYDFLNRIIKEEFSTGLVKKYEYDIHGNRIKTIIESDEGVKTTSAVFDCFNRPLLQVDEEGYKTSFEYKHGVINEKGERVLRTIVTDPKGGKLISDQNHFNEVCRTERRSPFGILLSLEEKEFLLNGSLRLVRDFVVVEGEITSSVERVYEYKEGNLVEMIEGFNTDSPKVTRYKYNKKGQQVEMIKPDGVALTKTFDPFSRLLTLNSSDGQISYEYTYNKNDQIIEVKNGEFFTKREYNTQGQISLERFETGDTLGFEYDPLGRIKKVIYPDLSEVQYVYGQKGLEQVLRGDFEFQIEVNSQGCPKKMIFPEKGGTLKWGYDEKGRLSLLEHELFSVSVPEKGFDERGNLLKLNQNGVSEEFSYDDLDHLLGECVYDSIGNRLKKGSEKYTYNGLNQRSDLCYDANGNLIFDGKVYYSYDPLNRLVAVNGKNVYRYDPFNRLLRDDKRQFFYGNSCMLGMRDQKGLSCRVLSTLKREIGTTLFIETKEAAFVVIPDLFGSVKALIDPKSGVCKEETEYKPFGEGGLKKTPFGYQGKYTEDELVFFGERVYSKELGCFLTCDPLGFSQGANLYGYVRNNPFKNCDHFGLSTAERDIFSFSRLFRLAFGLQRYGEEGYINSYDDTDVFFGPPRELSNTEIYRAPTRNSSYEPHKMVTFLNGISTDEGVQSQNYLFFSDIMREGQFVGVHHKTNMMEGILDDGLRYVYSKIDERVSNASIALMGVWEEHLKNYPDNGEILHICHSEGALHTKHALREFPVDLKSKINVVVIAGAAYIPQQDCKKLWHYVSTRDCVPWVDPLGRARANLEGTLNVLEPHQKAPWFDHGFLSPTYVNSIRMSIINFFD